MKPIFNEDSLQAIRATLSTPQKITLIAHIAPDGDAVGSTVSLSNVLRKMGHQTTILYPTPFPEGFYFLNGTEDILIGKSEPDKVREAITNADVLFCLDFNDPKRAEIWGDEIVNSKAFKILIDHHLNPIDFTDIVISFPSSSSTCLLIYHFLIAIGWEEYIDRDIAEAIYFGMMTDTGGFSYNSEDPHIYTTISALLEKGIRKDDITAAVTRSYSVDKLKLNAYAILNNMHILPQCQSAIITLTNLEKKKFNYKVGDTEGLVNVPLEAKEILFSVFIYEVGKMCKLSLRSKGKFPANEFAQRFFNGGGHLNAAGAELYDTTIEEAVKIVKEALKIFNPKGMQCNE